MFGVISSSSVGLGASSPFGLILGLGLAVVLVIVGGFLIRAARRWYRDTETDSPGSCGFSLQELRELRATGEITQEEYDAARAIILGSVGKKSGKSGVSEQKREAHKG